MLAITSGSWIDVATWWMKYTSTARSTSTSPNAIVMDRCGTKSPSVPCATDPNARTTNTKLATNVPSVTWVPRSRRKLRRMRGPN